MADTFCVIMAKKKKKKHGVDGYMTVNDLAKKLGISDSLARRYLRQGRIAGAFNLGRLWLIPKDAADVFMAEPRPVGNPLLGRRRKGG